MNLLILIKVALRNLLVNKLRSFLTILGISFGIAAVIATLGATEGTRKQIYEELGSLGTDMLMVHTWPKSGQIRHIPLQESDADIIKNMCPNVRQVVSVAYENMPVKHGRKGLNLGIKGVSPNYRIVRNYNTQIGRFFSEQEEKSYALVCTLGASAKNKLFDKINPIGKNIIVGSGAVQAILKVIGVMEEKGGGLEGGVIKDDQIYVPFKTALKLIFGPSEIYFLAQVVDEANIEEAMAEINFFLKSKHPTLEVWSQKELIEISSSILMKLTLSGLALVIICLTIGGIGIMNIMLVSVTERRREIGIRKSLGAKRRDILKQFLTEATIISSLGGIFGILLGVIMNRFITTRILGWPADVSITSILLILFFSACVGLFFGILPAQKAAKLDPIEALRSL